MTPVFSPADDYSFGILQSGIHWAWFMARCSTLKGDFRYTSDTVFDTFPWPQFGFGVRPSGGPASGRSKARKTPSVKPPKGGTPNEDALAKIRAVAEAARALRQLRREIMEANGWSLRVLYRTLETPGANCLRAAHAALDTTVRRAYGMKPEEDILAFLLKLNLELADREAKGTSITPPGLPAFVPQPQSFVSDDCVSVAEPEPGPKPGKPPPPGQSTPQSEADAVHFYSAKEEPPPYG